MWALGAERKEQTSRAGREFAVGRTYLIKTSFLITHLNIYQDGKWLFGIRKNKILNTYAVFYYYKSTYICNIYTHIHKEPFE